MSDHDPYQTPEQRIPADHPSQISWPPAQTAAVAGPVQTYSGMAVTSMVLGIVGVFLSWFLVGIPSILAVIFGHVALSDINKTKRPGSGMAKAGLATGYTVIGLWLLIFVLALGSL
jgi:hypothetical protein